MGFPGGSNGKESTCNAGDLSLIPGLGRSPGEENSYPLQYSCQENSTDRRAWQATVHVYCQFSCVQLFATLWTVAHQTPLSMGILLAKILEWVAISDSTASSWPRDRTHISCLLHWQECSLPLAPPGKPMWSESYLKSKVFQAVYMWGISS